MDLKIFALQLLASAGFIGGIVYGLRVRVFTIGSKKEIITALTVIAVSLMIWVGLFFI